jgi:1,2-diacylglycerol 3-beta-glucosyltransferase
MTDAAIGLRLGSGLVSALSVADLTLAAVGVPVALAGAYVGALSIPRRLVIPSATDHVRIAVVVPAHNEAAIVATTVASLLRTEYPAARRRVIVVADNCTDTTAAVAAAAGAEVFERTDLTKRGKGYALDYAFNVLLDEDWADAVAVVDADTVVEENLLQAFAARFAKGEQAVQANYEVLNVDDSWRTRLMHIAFTAFHEVRGTGREAMHLSAGLRGNGMAFSTSTIRKIPHRAFSVVEDLEYGIMLGLEGIRVAYAHETTVSGDMPADAESSVSQRERWERGRQTVRKMYVRRLLMRAIRQRSLTMVDLAADVMMPPMGKVVVPAAAGLLGSAVLAATAIATRNPRRLVSPWVFGVATAGVALNVAEGWRRSGAGVSGLSDLANVPKYLRWKATGKGESTTTAEQGVWVRTARSHEVVTHEVVTHEVVTHEVVTPDGGSRSADPQTVSPEISPVSVSADLASSRGAS